jgi:hypothetical protein
MTGLAAVAVEDDLDLRAGGAEAIDRHHVGRAAGAENGGHADTRARRKLGERREGREADAAAEDRDMPPVRLERKAFAQRAENPQRLAYTQRA